MQAQSAFEQTHAHDLLVDCLDYEATIQKIAEITVSSLASWCIVDLVDSEGKVQRVGGAHRDPEKQELVRELYTHYQAKPSLKRGVHKVIETGKSVLIPEVPEEIMKARADDARHAYLISELGSRSYMCVPLVARGRTIGTILLFSADAVFGSSDLKRAEELAERFALAIDNSRIHKSANEAIRLREELLSIAGHELRSPLTWLNVQGTRIQRVLESYHLKPEDSAQLKKLLETSDREVQRLTRLVNQLLDCSHIKCKQMSLNLEELDLVALAKDVAHRLEFQASESGCEIRLVSDSPVVGSWDRFRLEQVFVNLISNSIKYAPGKPIEILVAQTDTHAVFHVRDHGCGISVGDRMRIFEAFERASRESSTPGLGLGLYICKMVVEAHGGVIHVESDLGLGSTFMVRLPKRTAR